MKLCKVCLKTYRYNNKGAEKPWPGYVYHDEPTRLCLRHHSYNLAFNASRRSKIRKGTLGGTSKEITELYKRCKEIEKDTGIRMQVDHIVPINGKNVSGLHVIGNLQIITARDNAKKGNKFV